MDTLAETINARRARGADCNRIDGGSLQAVACQDEALPKTPELSILIGGNAPNHWNDGRERRRVGRDRADGWRP
ncbi:hypothetical protein [Aureimonas jatrophae]|uniref:hypothetical protein n=1 Tax=Aureimonas jatrophae TaxID=1166073 RepID=UPI000B812246|nr:hypothetical protein [Aureimonas jatrophae]MBB3952932.1 hypothetical protein [Aureimonas jatrophae]